MKKSILFQISRQTQLLQCAYPGAVSTREELELTCLLKLCTIRVEFSTGGITFKTEKSYKSSGAEEQLLSVPCLVMPVGKRFIKRYSEKMEA